MRHEITAYTVKRFGIQQAHRLRDRFQATLNALAETPLIGHSSEELDRRVELTESRWPTWATAGPWAEPPGP